MIPDFGIEKIYIHVILKDARPKASIQNAPTANHKFLRRTHVANWIPSQTKKETNLNEER